MMLCEACGAPMHRRGHEKPCEFARRRTCGRSCGHRLRKTKPSDFWERTIPEPNTGCFLWTGPIDDHGYGRQGSERAHRMSWILTSGPIPRGFCVCHKCDTPACVNPEHLFLGTQLDNIHDRHTKGRSRAAIGEANYHAKLTENDVRDIRELFASGGQTFASIGRRYGITYVNVAHIVKRKLWRHVA